MARQIQNGTGKPGAGISRICAIPLLGLMLTLPADAADKPWSEHALGPRLDLEEIDPATEAGRQALMDRGEHLFSARFTVLDGAGRPMATQAIVPTKRKRPAPGTFQRMSGPDSNACASCHNEPTAGGAGSFTANAFVTEGFESADFDSLDPQFSNERGTNHVFGSGLIELLAREMTAELQAQRTNALAEARRSGDPVHADLSAKGVSFGTLTARSDGIVDLSEIDGVDTDLVIRPFSQKGVMTSLRQFTINAMNHHHGMQAQERYGSRWTGEADFDEDGISDELTDADITALVIWQATRPPPTRRTGIAPDWQEMADGGEELFDRIGCASCHIPALPLDSAAFTDPNLYDMAGTLRPGERDRTFTVDLAHGLERDAEGRLLVPLFGDLKRHRISDKHVDTLGNELLSQRFVDRDVFQTTELWGIGSTAPYGHRGDITTLDEMIRVHAGDATDVRKRYEALPGIDRQRIIAFLKTLVIEP